MSESASLPEVTCPYKAVCAECPGNPWVSFNVILNSGDTIEVLDVRQIRLEGDELVVTPAAGEAVRFPVDEIYYAGCSQTMPPFPG
jgi:hypothetical protein